MTNKANTEEITLDSPIQRGEKTIEKIFLRKPSSGELRGLALSDVLHLQVDALVKLTPRLSSPALTEPEMRNLDPADLVQIGGAIAGFLLTKRAKGETA
ncbi:tail fiber protein [Litchfieldella anticariensis FP35 = DSM 16096]|uniref:Tail fiber protein n=1 Tax=Litchfieldella anticariensis (strain DSM 16096 / CECT 5854 / CIP 108499 / LMG 22089 / FP35) TaxID=1121939 RepID=S2L3Y2_LITA3|nr:phage tail assembly protein [Halomonas anticariensis]EPC02419.1 tail fiber protein [Halomonas anticariensis FP35 = DSM 16096]